MVIGSTGLSEISPILRDLEDEFDREINATCYSLNEFLGKIGSGNHFLTEVMGKEKIFLRGDENELAELIGEGQRERPSNQPTGN